MMRHAMKCLALVSLTFLTQCNGEPQLDSLEHLRCSGDGLCFTSQTEDLLAGGYRQGELEIEFDALYKTSTLNRLNGGSPYCVRILFENKHLRSFADNNNCPKDWYAPDKGIDGTERYKNYTKLAQAMQHDLDQQIFDSKLQEAWHELMLMTRDLAKERHPNFNDNVEHLDPPPNFPKSAANDEVIPSEKTITLDKMLTSPLSSSTSGAGSVTEAFRVDDPKLEYRQEIQLWSQPAKSLLFFGWDTRKHHSGTWTYIYSRRLGSQDNWEVKKILSQVIMVRGPSKRLCSCMLFVKICQLPEVGMRRVGSVREVGRLSICVTMIRLIKFGMLTVIGTVVITA